MIGFLCSRQSVDWLLGKHPGATKQPMARLRNVWEHPRTLVEGSGLELALS